MAERTPLWRSKGTHLRVLDQLLTDLCCLLVMCRRSFVCTPSYCVAHITSIAVDMIAPKVHGGDQEDKLIVSVSKHVFEKAKAKKHGR